MQPEEELKDTVIHGYKWPSYLPAYDVLSRVQFVTAVNHPCLLQVDITLDCNKITLFSTENGNQNIKGKILIPGFPKLI